MLDVGETMMRLLELRLGPCFISEDVDVEVGRSAPDLISRPPDYY
jgi:hypothetical protein